MNLSINIGDYFVSIDFRTISRKPIFEWRNFGKLGGYPKILIWWQFFYFNVEPPRSFGVFCHDYEDDEGRQDCPCGDTYIECCQGQCVDFDA